MSSFEAYYQNIYENRWSELKAALLSPAPKVVRDCFAGFANYVLDAASITAAQALQTSPGHQVLDLCSAPGGKALVLLEALQGKGLLTANELSMNRRMRLKEVLSSHVPPQFHPNFTVTGYDGNQFGLKKPNSYDRVLLDAPCSSEQHLLEADPEQTDWKVSRTKQLSQRQYSLLCAALLAVKPGGKIVYSTCSISPLENDEVVKRLLARKGESVELDLDVSDLEGLEKTEVGFQIFPDRFAGQGPIYFSRLIKRS